MIVSNTSNGTAVPTSKDITSTHYDVAAANVELLDTVQKLEQRLSVSEEQRSKYEHALEHMQFVINATAVVVIIAVIAMIVIAEIGDSSCGYIGSTIFCIMIMNAIEIDRVRK